MDLYKVNLLPPELQREGTIDIRRLVVVVGAALPVAVILGCYIIFLINCTFIKNELDETKLQIASLSPAVSRVEDIMKERAELEETIKEFDEITKKRMSWSSLLSDLGNIAPVDLWLTGLEISDKAVKTSSDNAQKEPDPFARPNTVTLKGISRTLPSVGIFIRNLTGLNYFEEVKLVKVNAVSEGMEFEIIARVKEKD